MTKKAILVISFGTSHQETCEKNIGAIEEEIEEAFSGWEIRRAFTSGMIVNKMRKEYNIVINTVSEALANLKEEGFKTVIIQPTHIINGEEFDDIVNDVSPFRSSFEEILISTPLLTSSQDYFTVSSVLSSMLPVTEATVYCLMGHGTTHHADSAYAALDYRFKHMGRKDIFVGTVEGFPDLSAMMNQVAQLAPRKIVLLPLMVVAGDHAVNDMAGSEDSWKSSFEKQGYEVDCRLMGLGESKDIRKMYVDHVQQTVQEMCAPAN